MKQGLRAPAASGVTACSPSGLSRQEASHRSALRPTGAALLALAERVEALEGSDRALDAEIHRALFGTIMVSPCKVPLYKTAHPSNTASATPYHFTGYVEEAEMALPDDGGWPEWQITRRLCTGYHASVGTGSDGVGCETAALALCAAALRARAASADTRPQDEDPLGASLASGAVGEAETPKVSRP